MSKKNLVLMIALFLTVATLMAFWQVNHYDFTNFDDDTYVTENSHIQNGITMEGVRWAFTTGYANFWHPLTWISHMLDVQLFDLKAGRHHLTNLLFHIANTLLLFLVFHRMTKSLWRSAFVASLFALHPLHVESVAWVAERKDVLSTFFWMLTMGAYVYYVERPGLQRYLPVLVFFVLGLMAKPMLVTLPFVLLLLDYWPLRRFEQKTSAPEIQPEASKPLPADKRKKKAKKKAIAAVAVKEEKPADVKYQWPLIRPLLWEKIPFFVLTVLSSIAAYIAQLKGGAIGSTETFPLSVRIANALVSYIIYIGKMIWPSNLAAFYPHPGLWPSWQILGAFLLLITITLAAVWTVKRFPYLAVGWLWYAGTLVPVIGLVQVGDHAMADRYTYIPLIGLFIMVAWGIPELLKKWRYRQEILFASSAVGISCLIFVTVTQTGYWKNNFTLFEHAANVTVRNNVAYYNLGNAYMTIGDYKRAIGDFDRAIEINPKLADAYSNRGNAYAALGNYKRAIEDLDRAVGINPKLAKGYYNRGSAYAALGNYTQAIGNFDRAIEIDPQYAKAYSNRGSSYAALGNYGRAIEDLGRAIEINPKLAEVYVNLGIAYAALGNYRQAIGNFDRAIEINPKLAVAYYIRGNAYYRLGNDSQGLRDVQTAALLGSQIAQNFLRSRGIK